MREKLERVIVKKALQAKLKLCVGLPPRASKQEALNKLASAGADSVMRLDQTAKSTPVDIETKHELSKMTKLANELHKSFRKPKHLRKIYFRSKYNIWNADLIIMPPENDYKYVLTVLDGYTRYAWCVPFDCTSEVSPAVEKSSIFILFRMFSIVLPKKALFIVFH